MHAQDEDDDLKEKDKEGRLPYVGRRDIDKWSAPQIDRTRTKEIVFTDDMWVDGQHISTSLTTIALEPEGDGTRLAYTEQGVHFDGREEGTRGILDNLGTFLVVGS